MSREVIPRYIKLYELVDALKVLYYGLEEGCELIRLAENAFSGCAGTQRENQFELGDYLEACFYEEGLEDGRGR